MSEIINETINELNKPTQNNVFSIEDNPVTVLEKINQVERYLKEIDTHVDTSINTANEALEKANNAFEANGTLVKINGENQLTWSADFAESERQKSKNLFNINKLSFGYASGSWSINYNTGTITFVNSVDNSTSEFRLKDFTDLKAGKTYKLSYAYTGTPTNLFIYLNGSDSTWLNGNTHTITQAELDSGIHMYGSNTGTVTLSDIIMVEDGVDIDYQQYNGAIVHKSEIEPVLIYDKDTKNTIGGTAYTDGIPINNTYIGTDFSSYKKVEIIGVNRNVPVISTIDLTLKTNDTYYYGSGGMTYNAPFGDANQYYLFMGCAISIDKTQLILYKAGYNDTVETEHKVIRIVGYK